MNSLVFARGYCLADLDVFAARAGFKMNLSPFQWLLIIVLDMLIKVVVILFAGVLVTFGTEPVGPFVFAAVAISVFHFVCMFLASSLVVSLELIRVELSRAVKFPLVLIVANIMFASSLTAFMILSVRRDEIGPTPYQDVVISLILVVTNLIPIAIAAAYRGILSRARRPR